MEIKKTDSALWLSSEGITFFLITLFVFLLPLTFSPSQYVNFLFSKSIPLFVVTIAALFFFIFKIFRDGQYRISLSPFFYIGLFIPLWYIFSSFFAVNGHSAFIGTGIETDTASFIAVLFLFAFLVTYFMRTKDKIFMAYLAFGSSYVLLALFHTVRLFFPSVLSFHVFLSTTSNTIGKWNELAVVSGIALLLSLLSIEFLKLTRGFKIFSYVILVLSVFLTAVTNFALISENSFQVSFFSLIGVFALVFFVYFLSSSYEQSRKEAAIGDDVVDRAAASKSFKKRRIPYASLVVLIISVIFTFGYREIGSYVQNHFGVSSYEERPTWNWTAKTAWSSLKEKPFTGFGPNNFSTSWALNKPQDVNQTSVWSNDFISGVGYIPSAIVTTGPVGFIAWLLFLAAFLTFGIRSLFVKYKDRFSHYLTVSSFLVSLFLWIVTFMYIPTTVVLVLTFLFTGLFLASLLREGLLKEKTFVFENSREKTFASIMVLVVILVASIFWAYAVGQVFASSVYASKGAVQYANAANDADLLKAQELYTEALRISPSDSYLRSITNINLARAQLTLNDQSLSQDQLRTNFIASYQNAYGAANDAVKYDPNNYQNYLVRGAVSESIVGLGVPTVAGSGVPDAYTDAKTNYAQAEKLDPRNPLIPLLMARLDFSKKDDASAKQDIANALNLKANYPDAYLLLSQIELSENNTDAAIDTLTGGSLIAPDSNLFYTLGALRLNANDYKDAADAFEKSVILSPYYSNARYYLALSYYNLGRTNDAIVQLQQIKLLDPTNTDIDPLIKSLQSGSALPANATSTPAIGTSKPSENQTPQ